MGEVKIGSVALLDFIGAAGMVSHFFRGNRALSDVSWVVKETLELEMDGEDTEAGEKQEGVIIGLGRVHVHLLLSRWLSSRVWPVELL